MAGFIARLLLWQIVGADRNPSARVHVKPMNDPAPSIARDFVHKGFSFPRDKDESPKPIFRSVQAVLSMTADPEAHSPRRPSRTKPSP